MDVQDNLAQRIEKGMVRHLTWLTPTRFVAAGGGSLQCMRR